MSLDVATISYVLLIEALIWSLILLFRVAATAVVGDFVLSSAKIGTIGYRESSFDACETKKQDAKAKSVRKVSQLPTNAVIKYSFIADTYRLDELSINPRRFTLGGLLEVLQNCFQVRGQSYLLESCCRRHAHVVLQ